jgi:thioredoxin reductase
MNTHLFDVIVVGGSYAGLAAGMTLGRSLRNTLIIDSGKPCNRQTPHSHNFITHDGSTPAAIAGKAKAQVLQYPTVQFHQGVAIAAAAAHNQFTVTTQAGETFAAKKLLFATGIADELLPVPGAAECWGISMLHCPYCHGYEVRNEPLALIGNGDMAFEFGRMLSNWSPKLTLLTNGPSTLSEEHTGKLQLHHIAIIEKQIAAFEHTNGHMHKIVFSDNSSLPVTAVFAKAGIKQHCDIPQQLGCQLNQQGLIQVDDFQRTSVPGVYAAGDNSSMFRAVSMAVAAGTKAGALINKELTDESF